MTEGCLLSQFTVEKTGLEDLKQNGTITLENLFISF